MQQTECAIVGAGILGLTTAWHLSRQGRQVTVFERDPRPVGASIRNFGMIWPIGQPPGRLLELARQSRAFWLEMAAETGLAYRAEGSLHLAYQADEWQVLQEFAAGAEGYELALLSPAETLAKSPAAHPKGLLGSLWSATELIVDPRAVPGTLMAWLQERGVRFEMGLAVTAVESGRLEVGDKSWRCDKCFVCGGADHETLFPGLLAGRLTKVKLQMMRTAAQPGQWQMGPALAAGLTLQHYAAFASCPGLPALKARIAAEQPWANDWGIHVMMSQNPAGELVIGDSHEYGSGHDPFLQEEIDARILGYLHKFAQMPAPEIVTRWHGIYSKRTDGGSYLYLQPIPGVHLLTGIGGAGMTLSFGVTAALLTGRLETG